MQRQIIDNRVGVPDTDFIPRFIMPGNDEFPKELAVIKPILDYGNDRPGLPRCLQAVADDFNRRNGTNIGRENVILASGARGAMSSAVLSVLGKTRRLGHNFRPKVLLMQPGYNLFATQYDGFGCELEFVSMVGVAGDDERLARIAEKLDAETLFLPLCSPNNPTGEILSEYFLRGILGLMNEYPYLHIIYDSIYAPIVRNAGIKVPNIFALAADEEIRSRIYVIDSLSKAYSWPGIHAGWLITAKAAQIEEIQKYKDAQFGSLTHEQQMAITAACEFTPKLLPRYFDEINQIYNKRLELVHEKLHQIKGFKSEIPAGSFYYWADFGFDTKPMVAALAEQGILLAYGGKFGDGNCVRVNCGAKLKDLTVICEVIVAYIAAAKIALT